MIFLFLSPFYPFSFCFLSFFFPFSIRLLFVSYPFAIPSFFFSFPSLSRFSDKNDQNLISLFCKSLRRTNAGSPLLLLIYTKKRIIILLEKQISNCLALQYNNTFYITKSIIIMSLCNTLCT